MSGNKTPSFYIGGAFTFCIFCSVMAVSIKLSVQTRLHQISAIAKWTTDVVSVPKQKFWIAKPVFGN
ncbi:hypothetical protein B6N25_11260 [Sphingobacteriales bacterium TSM_CSS]|nr:hypothetical protein B6N25_11260 [Sphingobacteriales bacterium TSM_CSS]